LGGSVVTGPCRRRSARRGLPTTLPAVYRLALYEAAGVGFAVMSGFSNGITPIRGNYSPDKEFRYLRHCCYSPLLLATGGVISASLCMSPCRSDCLISHQTTMRPGVQSLRIPMARFPADCPHQSDCHCSSNDERVPLDSRVSQHTARFYNGQSRNHRYSYGRRLPGLQFRASPLRANPSH